MFRVGDKIVTVVDFNNIKKGAIGEILDIRHGIFSISFNDYIGKYPMRNGFAYKIGTLVRHSECENIGTVIYNHSDGGSVVKWRDGEPARYNFNSNTLQTNTKESKMLKKKAETKLEKEATKLGIQDSIDKIKEVRRKETQDTMDVFISAEKNARAYRIKSDNYRELLGVTDSQMKELF